MPNNIKGGKGDKLTPKDVKPDELRMGIKVETEHTNNQSIAQEIALDHLAEDPKYYTKLRTIHKEKITLLTKKLEETSGKKVVLKEMTNSNSSLKFSDKTSGKEIRIGNEPVGYVYFLKKLNNKEKFLNEFDYDDNLVNFFKEKNIPNKFTSIQVTTLSIDKKYRGKGYAKEALKKGEIANSVMYLEIGISKKDNIDEPARIEIYSRMGFTIFKIKKLKMQFAIKYIS